MAVNLPTPGGDAGVWDDKLNAAITGIDQRLTTVETAPAPTTSRFVPVVIFNGESNSGGYAQNSLALPSKLAPRPAVQIFNNTTLASFDTLQVGVNNLIGHTGLSDLYSTTTHGWELALANSVEAGLWWDNPVYLIKTGQGGSRISQWGATGAYYLTFLDRVRNGLGLLRAQGKVPVIYFWYSLGINDAIDGKGDNGPLEAQWLLDVKAYHARVRKEIGYVPIFYCQAMSVSLGVNLNDAILQYDADDPMLISIDSTGATVRTDNNHWDYGGMKVMGGRLVAASTAFGQHEGYLLQQTAMLAGGTGLSMPNDAPSLVRTPAAVSFVEGSAGSTFTVVLNKVPIGNVVVTVAASGGNVTPAPASLTFTTSNWATPQTVTVTSPNDGTQSGSRSSTVTLSSVSVLASATVAVTVTDAYVPPGPANTALPAITGATTLGAVLTCSTGTWTGSPTGYTYQWTRDALVIAGETVATHTIVAADQGHTLLCTVTATNAQGSVAAIAPSVSVPADLGSYTAYAWKNLANATQDGQSQIVATGTMPAGGNAVGSVDSTAPFRIKAYYAAASDAAATVFQLEETDGLTDFTWGPMQFATGIYASGGNWYMATAGGTPPPTLITPAPVVTYPLHVRMDKSGNDVVYSTSTNGSTWTTIATHTGVLVGKTLLYPRIVFASVSANQKVLVSHDDSVNALAKPVSIGAPALSGSINLAGVLTCTTGQWSGIPSTYAYQWKRDGVDIVGQTTNAHTIVSADQAHVMTCAVTASNVQGSTVAVSNSLTASGLVPYSWKNISNASEDASNWLICTDTTVPAGGQSIGTVDVSKPFRLVMEIPSPSTLSTASLLVLDDPADTTVNWGGGQTFVTGCYQSSNAMNSAINGAAAISWGYSLPSYPASIKLEKSVDDVLYSVSLDGGLTWTLRYTHVGVLAGKTILNPKIIFATGAAGKKRPAFHDITLE